MCILLGIYFHNADICDLQTSEPNIFEQITNSAESGLRVLLMV